MDATTLAVLINRGTAADLDTAAQALEESGEGVKLHPQILESAKARISREWDSVGPKATHAEHRAACRSTCRLVAAATGLEW